MLRSTQPDRRPELDGPTTVSIAAPVWLGSAAGISIVTSALPGEYLAGALVVLMLSGGEALEAYAVWSASSLLEALARRMPSVAHRRSGDQLGTIATPVAVGITLAAWAASGDATRFLAVLVIATPCPLLIAIPVAIISAISLSACRGIIVQDPAALERIDTCRTAIFDKTGTLTYGRPRFIRVDSSPGFTEPEVLRLVASLERYSKHPLALAIVDAAHERNLSLLDASEAREPPGAGLSGTVGTRSVQVTSRSHLVAAEPDLESEIPSFAGGMECVVTIDGRYAGVLTFRDQPRPEGASFIHHLRPSHRFDRVLIVSGDRESEVRYRADQVGIAEAYASRTPEE
jgi:P-type E1-E2 ATPase